MLNYEEFLSKSHSLLIAPAGYGKTHTISECLKYTEGKQLILTHTHAGVSSIKEKLKKAKIDSKKYSVETITSYAQKYVLAYCKKSEIPNQEDSKKYYPFIINSFIELLKLNPIKIIIKSNYSGLFVDEYQDCTEHQHEIVLLLANLFPCRILGDPLQGIFSFNDRLVDLDNAEDMKEFLDDSFELVTPWRWKIGGNEKLGNDLKDIRKLLLEKEPVDLSLFSSISLRKTNDLFSEHSKEIYKIINNEKSLLVISPISTNNSSRLSFIQRFSNLCLLMESIDDKDFYKISKELDELASNYNFLILRSILLKLFAATEIKKWFNDNGVVSKKAIEDKEKIKPFKDRLNNLNSTFSFDELFKLLNDITKILKIKCYRKELLYSLKIALQEAQEQKITVYEAMTNNRNLVRRNGKKVTGKCVGTTLLTKGLEFETVIIIDAHKFDCPKNLYVALTRASKNLYIFSSTDMLRPYKND